jgi:hypothetical protein
MLADCQPHPSHPDPCSIENGDTVFEGWRGVEWSVSSCERHEPDDKNAYAYSFMTLDRTGAGGVN